MLQGIHDRLQARKELAIAKVAPKLAGVDDVAEAEEILKELRDEMLRVAPTVPRISTGEGLIPETEQGYVIFDGLRASMKRVMGQNGSTSCFRRSAENSGFGSPPAARAPRLTISPPLKYPRPAL